MTYDYTQLPHAGIRTLAPYIPGKSTAALTKELHLNDIIKMASNENPWGCSQTVIQALSTLTPHQLATYTVSTEHPFRQQLADHLSLPTDMLMLSNGSDALFNLLLVCFALHTDKHILTHEAAFISYEIQATTLGIDTIHVPLKSDWQVDIDAIIHTCTEKTALIFLANPNNPTGALIPSIEIIHLLDHIPASTLVVLDEAYHEYLVPTEQSIPHQLLAKYSNLIITRTFSKAYGLAALRLGYALANAAIIALLYRIQLPFAVNQAVLFAAAAALDDQVFIQHSVLMNTQERTKMQQSLANFGLNQLPSVCNFITFNCGCDAKTMDQQLQRQGIITRPLTPYGLTRYLRVTIGTPDQNQRFLRTLQHCITGIIHDESIK